MIGLACREAMHAFAGELATLHGVDVSGIPAAKTVDRLRAVLKARRSNMSEKVYAASEALDAFLLTYLILLPTAS